MTPTATITVVSGPDRGRVFHLDDQLLHLGTGPENHITLRDASAEEHTASIVCRGGRYAIFSPFEKLVEVDGNAIPVAQWIWLPETARLRVGAHTKLLFNAAQPPAEATEIAAPHSSHRPALKRNRPQRRQIARFITDRPGQPLVKLGEDGRLPELALADSEPGNKLPEKPATPRSPLLVYLAAAASLLFSLGLLFVEARPPTASAHDKARARREIAEFYKAQETELQPYQRLLRQARLAQARGDRRAEQAAYRRVLELLNSEDNGPYTGLTGTRQNDERLRTTISILLTD